ncbi:uncharacterized protein LOC126834497 isoform X2 [Adelges cooleyi]|uniref:uncharacterized protein LOC126834497 isoform X2 n=1 Tax=Adelges cooleyi TaxID=133065 RepID=UPI00217FE556|nr:uncharacterized protein LOC126834497 isoform X2 [Adelges cooleyi]
MNEKVSLIFVLIAVVQWSSAEGNNYKLLLNNNSPVTTGSTVTVNATVVDQKGACASGKLTFRYEDDAFPEHKYSMQIKSCEAIFHVPFDNKNGPSTYRYQIDVLQELMPFINYPIANGRGDLIVTENLNGQLELFQNNTQIIKSSTQTTTYISSAFETLQKIELNKADFDYLNKSANSTVVHWFVDCVYQGNSTDYSFATNYTVSGIQHDILGIVVATIGNKTTPTEPPPVTTTTTTPPNTNITTTTPLPSLKSHINISQNIVNNSTYNSECIEKKPFDLLMSVAKVDEDQKFGYFSGSILVKDPIENFRSQGKVWIEEGDMFDLQVNCNGSGPFRYCAHYVQGMYNVTGNESCLFERNLLQCQMNFFHLFREPTNYTLVIILANDVSKVVTPIGINIYKVKKQPQISVIVVPVTFSSIAVIIIVFGIAYYFQNRSRYMVEVADFDFANNSDMECKTFRERLRDAISQAINRTQDYSEYDGSEEQIGGLATPQNQKYGSMQ